MCLMLVCMSTTVWQLFKISKLWLGNKILPKFQGTERTPCMRRYLATDFPLVSSALPSASRRDNVWDCTTFVLPQRSPTSKRVKYTQFDAAATAMHGMSCDISERTGLRVSSTNVTHVHTHARPHTHHAFDHGSSAGE